MKPPTYAQARKLAWSFEHNRPIAIQVRGRAGQKPYIDPTDNALKTRGMIAPVGEPEILNGITYQPHEITARGFEALSLYFARCAKFWRTGNEPRPDAEV